MHLLQYDVLLLLVSYDDVQLRLIAHHTFFDVVQCIRFEAKINHISNDPDCKIISNVIVILTIFALFRIYNDQYESKILWKKVIKKILDIFP